MGRLSNSSCPPKPAGQPEHRAAALSFDALPHYPRPRLLLLAVVLLGLLPSLACSSFGSKPDRPRYIYSPDEFRTALAERVPGLTGRLLEPPFLVPDEAVELVTRQVERAPKGPERVHALVETLQADPPDGFGLRYHWQMSATAPGTLESGKGNCIAFASVLVGLGRRLGWPIYYAVASNRQPETHELEELSVVIDHMVVIVAAQSFQMIVDFTGEVNETSRLKPIDDLSAYAHFINNVTGQQVIAIDSGLGDENWESALEGFRLATQIDPELGRAFNNAGLALTRLGRYDEARVAYQRAVELETAFGSAERNLSLMETRSRGKTTVMPADADASARDPRADEDPP